MQRGTGEGGGEEATEVECAGQRILAGGGGAPEAVCRAAGGVTRWRATTEDATWGRGVRERRRRGGRRRAVRLVGGGTRKRRRAYWSAKFDNLY
jgi:hypothetical protein